MEIQMIDEVMKQYVATGELSVSFCMNRANIGGSGSYISKKVEELVFGIWRKNKG